MTLLSNKELHRRIVTRNELVHGLRSADLTSSDAPIQPSSIDLTIGRILLPPAKSDFPRPVEEIDDFYILPPGGSVLIKTRERLEIPADMGGILLPKNGHFASKGILITNFGHVDPGFEGHLKCTLINFGHDDFILEANSKNAIASLLFFELDQRASPDWSTHNRHGHQNEYTHARVLSKDFLDIPNRLAEITDTKLSAALKRRDIWTIWGPILAIVVATGGVVVPILMSMNEKWVSLNSTVSEIRRDLTELKGATPSKR
jgi:dCTP deaminase